MCDTTVRVPAEGPVLFGKNSDREPTEAQAVERLPAAEHGRGALVRCTWVQVPQVRRTHEVVLSRPAWMWGAEMGVNARGVAIGNEAVFTRVPVARTGLTGMDLLRLALERADDAEQALQVITELLAEYPQGGGMGHRNRGFRYHSSFLIADPRSAWLLETAGRFWAARRVTGTLAISNVLTIGRDADRLHPGAVAHARTRGWCRGESDFDFARIFGRPGFRLLTGGDVRRACLAGLLGEGEPGAEAVMAALQDHAGHAPADGWRMVMPCAHASWWPTRHAGQTTGSLVARLSGRPEVWATGTSSPCLSVFKPVPFGHPTLEGLPPAPAAPDGDSLWWRHERLHRRVLEDWESRRGVFEAERRALQARALAVGQNPAEARAVWEDHRARIVDWDRAAAASGRRRRSPFRLWWGGRPSAEPAP